MHLKSIEFFGFKGPNGKFEIPRRAVFYGPNGAGKSRFGNGVQFALEGMVDGKAQNEAVFQMMEPTGGGVAVSFADPEFHVERHLTSVKGSIRCAMSSTGCDSKDVGPNETNIATRIGEFPVRMNLAKFEGMSETERRQFCMSLCASSIDASDKNSLIIDRSKIEFFVEQFGETVQGWAQGAVGIKSLDELFVLTKRGKSSVHNQKRRDKIIDEFMTRLSDEEREQFDVAVQIVKKQIGETGDIAAGIKSVIANLKSTKTKAKKDYDSGVNESKRHAEKRKQMTPPPGSLPQLAAKREKLEKSLDEARRNLTAAKATVDSKNDIVKDLEEAGDAYSIKKEYLKTGKEELAAWDDSVVPRLEKEIEELLAGRKEIDAEIGESLRKRCDVIKGEGEKLSASLNHASTLEAGLQKEIHESELRIARASNGLLDIVDLLDKIECECMAVKSSKSWIALRLNIGERIDEETLDAEFATKKSLELRMEKQVKEIEQIKAGLDAKRETYTKASQKLNVHTDEQALLENVNKSIDDGVAERRSQIERIAKQKSELEQSIASLETSAEEKSARIKELQSRLSAVNKSTSGSSVEELDVIIQATEADLERAKKVEQEKRDVVNQDALLAQCQKEARDAGVLYEVIGRMQKAFTRVREQFMGLIVGPLLERINKMVAGQFGDTTSAYAKLESETGSPRFEIGMHMQVRDFEDKLAWREVSWFAMNGANACLFAAALLNAFLELKCESVDGLPFKGFFIEAGCLDALNFDRLLRGFDAAGDTLDNVLVFTHEMRDPFDSWKLIDLTR